MPSKTSSWMVLTYRKRANFMKKGRKVIFSVFFFSNLFKCLHKAFSLCILYSVPFENHPKNHIAMTKQQIYKIVATALTALLTCLALALGLTSCNVTRTITTQSSTTNAATPPSSSKPKPSKPTTPRRNNPGSALAVPPCFVPFSEQTLRANEFLIFNF